MFWKTASGVALTLGALLCTGCQTTLTQTIESATEDLLLNHDLDSPTIAIVVYGDGSRSMSPVLITTVWDVIDRLLVNRPNIRSVSPDLIRKTLDDSQRRPTDLYTQDGRAAFLNLLAVERVRAHFFLMAKLSQQKQKTGPGVRDPLLLLNLELVDTNTGERISKEAAWLELDKYR